MAQYNEAMNGFLDVWFVNQFDEGTLSMEGVNYIYGMSIIMGIALSLYGCNHTVCMLHATVILCSVTQVYRYLV